MSTHQVFKLFHIKLFFIFACYGSGNLPNLKANASLCSYMEARSLASKTIHQQGSCRRYCWVRYFCRDFSLPLVQEDVRYRYKAAAKLRVSIAAAAAVCQCILIPRTLEVKINRVLFCLHMQNKWQLFFRLMKNRCLKTCLRIFAFEFYNFLECFYRLG